MFYRLCVLFAIICIVFLETTNGAKFRNKFLNKNKFVRNKGSKYADYCKNFTYISQYIDHFNFNPSNNQQYQERYIIFDGYLPKYPRNNPIFFYTGNEGDIQWFCENTGFVWEIAAKFEALVVFAEHRYYGNSLPFGNKSFDNPFITYLTSEQALADYAYLIKNIKSNRTGLSMSPVIAFGGSYGGMLSAWFRMKYPNVVSGALAASAPVWQFVTDCDAFSAVVTNAFKRADSDCPDIIRASWDAINELSNTTQGLKNLTDIFKLCQPLTNGDDLKGWLNEIYGDIAMANYPYPTNFLAPLPGWPVKAMCDRITNGLNKSKPKDPITLLNALFNGVILYQNYTGQAKCLDIGSSTPFDINMISWTYQTCTEFVFPSCSNGQTDMFEPQSWDYESYSLSCYQLFNTRPREEWPVINYGSCYQDIKTHSNIIFSNGDLDPWSAGGVLANVNDKLPAIIIENGAHHLDLRESNINDTKAVILARLREIDIIQNWIEEHYIFNHIGL